MPSEMITLPGGNALYVGTAPMSCWLTASSRLSSVSITLLPEHARAVGLLLVEAAELAEKRTDGD